MPSAGPLIRGRELSPVRKTLSAFRKPFVALKMKSVSLKDRPLLLSAILSLVELFIWCWLGKLYSSNCSDPWLAFRDYSTERFGELIIAIATTFYVVFTYRLLKNSDAHRRYLTEPHLMVQWDQRRECTENQSSIMGKLADHIYGFWSDGARLNPDSFNEANMATIERFLILKLIDAKHGLNIQIGRITLAIKATLSAPGMQTVSFTDTICLKDDQIESSGETEITIVDLFPIPSSHAVVLNIDSITYEAIGGGRAVSKHSGPESKSVLGTFTGDDGQGPQPNPIDESPAG